MNLHEVDKELTIIEELHNIFIKSDECEYQLKDIKQYCFKKEDRGKLDRLYEAVRLVVKIGREIDFKHAIEWQENEAQDLAVRKMLEMGYTFSKPSKQVAS